MLTHSDLRSVKYEAGRITLRVGDYEHAFEVCPPDLGREMAYKVTKVALEKVRELLRPGNEKEAEVLRKRVIELLVSNGRD